MENMHNSGEQPQVNSFTEC